jgi:DNA invertase Pin-like site-specific DNA recombinase
MPSVHPDHFADQGISVTWTVDTATGQREKLLARRIAFEKASITERMKEGRTGKRARGGRPGGSAPYGYRVEGQGRLAMLVPEQTEQDMIATMRKLSGYMSLRKLAEKLDQDGIRTRRGTAFSPMHLHRILSRG